MAATRFAVAVWSGLMLVGGAGCSSGYQSSALQLKYEPAPGFSLEGEDPGPPARARFTHGLQILSLAGPPKPLDEGHLTALLGDLRNAASLGDLGELRNSRVGTIGAGPVARFETRHAGEESLLYVVPRKQRTLLVLLTADASEYSTRANRIEQSLSTFQPQD